MLKPQKFLVPLLSILMIALGAVAPAYAQGDLEAMAAESGIPTDESIISEGETLFKQNCTSCHRIHVELVGPALQNAWVRWDENSDRSTMRSFIKNSQAVIASGDEYANKLYEEYDKTAMTNFAWMSDEQVTSLLAYIQSETAKGPEIDPPGGSDDGDKVAVSGGVPSEYLNLIVAGLAIVLVLILIVLVLIVTVLRRYLMNREGELDEDDKEIMNEKVDVFAAMRSPQFLFIVVFIFTALVAKTGIDALYNIGVQQGYQPKQPIAFSHALHAGQYEIDCNYCHTGVRKSKSANIPSVNICMNCHSRVKTESPEIQKIWAAADFDPTTNSYGPNQKPIQWVRVHNLPDLAYFNHQQHVVVGEQECQTCHGPIEEMEVVYQHSRLTMGWCIDCHRKTEIDGDNAYYDKLVELHAEESKEAMVVEDIGGLECSKCHY